MVPKSTHVCAMSLVTVDFDRIRERSCGHSWEARIVLFQSLQVRASGLIASLSLKKLVTDIFIDLHLLRRWWQVVGVPIAGFSVFWDYDRYLAPEGFDAKSSGSLACAKHISVVY